MGAAPLQERLPEAPWPLDGAVLVHEAPGGLAALADGGDEVRVELRQGELVLRPLQQAPHHPRRRAVPPTEGQGHGYGHLPEPPVVPEGAFS